MGIRQTKFSHNTFLSGENKGEPPSAVRSSELDRTRNVEVRGPGINTRYGSAILTVAGTPEIPTPISGNPHIKSIHGFGNSIANDTIFSGSTFLYRDPETPTQIYTGLSSGLIFSYANASDICYATNGTDPVLYYDPNRSTSTMYVAGYDDMDYTGVTLANATSGSMPNGTYYYHIVFYDANTETKANPADTAVSHILAGVNDAVAFSALPLDASGRTTHWQFYRLDPGLFYYYYVGQKAYDAGDRTYTDELATPGRTRVLEFDNFKPDVSDGLALIASQRVMLYHVGNDITWSKRYRYQNVPTENRDSIDDNSQEIQICVEYKRAIVVFKTESIYVIRGDLLGDYSIKNFSRSIGTKSPKSVCVDSDGIYFLDSRGRPRYITSTDFDSEDIRDTTDISYKYRSKFDLISRSNYAFCHGVLWRTGDVEQYRLFVPIDNVDNSCDHCYVYDIGIARRNGGDSAWFDYAYNINILCSAIVPNSTTGDQIQVGDNFGLVHRVDIKGQFYDGNDFWEREEGDGTITYSTTTLTVSPTPAWTTNEWRGHIVILYEPFTFAELFRSRVVSNTANVLTLADDIEADVVETNCFITIGGYLTYFGTSWFSRDNAGKNVPEKISISFNREYNTTEEVYCFTNYDFNTIFNYNFDYFADETLSSLTPTSDIYLLSLPSASNLYNTAIYDTSTYGQVTFDIVDFLLRSFYYFSHVSWGLITRSANKPFGYIGASYYFRPKGNLL